MQLEILSVNRTRIAENDNKKDVISLVYFVISPANRLQKSNNKMKTRELHILYFYSYI
jgi:hypothetical protein